MNPELYRKQFEDEIFNKFFLAHIKYTPGPGINLRSMTDITKAELVARDADNYAHEDVSALWHGYLMGIEAVNKSLQQTMVGADPYGY